MRGPDETPARAHPLRLRRRDGRGRRPPPAGRVWAFEPLPSHLNVMKRNLELNGILNCVAVLAAASDRTGNARLHVSRTNAADNAAFPTGAPRDVLEGRCWRLEEFFSEKLGDGGFMNVDPRG